MKGHSRRRIFPALFLPLLFALLFGAPQAPAFAQATPLIPGCSMTVTPTIIPVGGSVQVRWASANAVSGSITHVGTVGPSGAINLLPSSAAKTTFVGTFTGPGGTATCSATVTVTTGGATNSGGSTFGGTYDAGGTYSPGGGNATLPPQPTTAPTYDAGGTYTGGDKYSPGSTYQPTPYTVNASSFTTQPKGSSFSQTPSTVSTGGGGGGGIAGFLVPCGYSKTNSGSAGYTQDSTDCSICSLGQLSQNLINFMLMVAIPISAMLFAYAGILRFSAAVNPARKIQSNKIFWSVLVGFVIALSGYLIVQTMLNAFLSPQFKTGGWRWDTLQCNGKRARDSKIDQIFTGLFQPTGGGTFVSGGGPTGTGGGTTQPVFAKNLGGGQIEANFTTNRNDVSLQSGFTAAQNFQSQIDSACAQFGSGLPDCQTKVEAMIAVESSGQTGATSNVGARGLMQLMPDTARGLGFSCSLSDSACNINAGTKYMSQLYGTFNNDANMIAAYNAGPGAGPGQPFSASVNCPGLAAWQCSVNPGGLAETQTHVADVCRVMALNNTSCK